MLTTGALPSIQQAGDFSTQRKAADGGYTFNLLPEESLPVTPGVPGSARKRKNNTAASSNATMMVVDESPARYSPDQVTEAIMSFADFLRFLVSRTVWEERERERARRFAPGAKELFWFSVSLYVVASS